ncbi:MAG: cysteine--tRNA ligase [Actinomycetota bacterium]|nr:cysteine--tRNA ligase [Actinomycetota bacterium]
MTLVIYDTLRREKVPFETREPGKAAIYVCGPTVYGDALLGHGRFAVVFDILNRYLRECGFEVTFVTNITDVDDKIIARANEEGVSAFVIADRYARRWAQAMDALGVMPPDVQPSATAHILEMQALIGQLLDREMAYVRQGNVLFRVRSFPGYGKLSGRRLEDAQQPTDVDVNVKEDPADFALWKAAKAGEPAWPSPWGPGRPGWHIECSAMAAKHLGPGFDLHGGGVDLIFPHHENEIAQHEAAYGEVFARCWMHNGMLRLAEAKMARSVGNVVSIDAALERWGRGPLRLWYASAAYRSPLTFEDALLDESVTAYDRMVTFARNARAAAGTVAPTAAVATSHEQAFHAALDDDLNLPAALAVLYEAVSDGNERLKTADRGDEEARGAVAALADLVIRLGDRVLGLGIEQNLRPTLELADRFAPIVEELLERRADARGARDFATADAIRDLLAGAGVVVEDLPGGVRWYLERTSRSDGLGGPRGGQLPATVSAPARLPTAEI